MKYILILLILLVHLQTQAQDISKLVNDYTTSYVNTGDFSGCILITENDNIIFKNCFGFANQSFKVLNEKNTKFKIGSVSKQFTAAAILIMEQEGLLKTTDTLSRFFPNNSNAEQITIQQLLTHTSGITDIYNVPDFNKLSCQKKTISELSKLVLDSELEFEPGTQYQYSNGGYAVLAEIIEKVNSTSYQEFLNDHIFQRLNMTSTGHHKSNDVVPDLAVGYDPSGYKDVKITDFLDPELLKGSGSLYSTVQDLQIWINSIKNKSLLSKSSYEKLLADYGHNYGFGVSVYKSFDKKVFGHDGRVNGYIADYLHYEEPGISVIILGNLQTGVADFFRRDIAAIVFNKAYESRAKRIPAADDPKIDKEKIIGTYAFGPNFKVYIEDIEGSIQARANEGGYSELVLLEDKRFFSRTLYSYIAFKEDDQGNTVKMVWTNNDGNSFEGLKDN
jgi:CubicO group peptidase (beta-lactamase class C family)